MLQLCPRKALRFSGILAIASALVLLPEQPLDAAEPAPFRTLRGTYKGVATITIAKNNRRTLSGPAKVKVRLSRSRRVLQIAISGRVTSNNKTGTLSGTYRISAGGNARMQMTEKLTPGNINGAGTGNIGRRGGRFTLRSSAYDSQGVGVSAGNIKLRGTTLQITQKFKSNNSAVDISIIAPKAGKR